MSVQATVNAAPLVSIGVPTYNRPERLARALAQLSRQTYENIEIIVSDNCSPGEATREVVAAQAASDPRIVYHRQEAAIPAIDNFRFVLSRATGKYFMWATDDDEREPGYVEALVDVLERDTQCVLAYSDARLTRDGAVQATLNSQIDTAHPSPLARARRVLLHQNLNNEICGLFRRGVLATHSFPQFFGSDHAILVHAAMHGGIRKGPPGLFSLALGGIGNTAEGVIRALNLPRSTWNLYFGPLAQATGMYEWCVKRFQLGFSPRLSLLSILIQRLLCTSVYRNDLIIGLARFVADSGRRWLPRAVSIPGRAFRRLGMVVDFVRVARSVRRNLGRPRAAATDQGRILLISLEGMNHFIAVLWGVMGWGLRSHGYSVEAVSLSGALRNNRLYRLFGIPVILFDKLDEINMSSASDLERLAHAIESADSFPSLLGVEWHGLPLGKFAVSTYCRENKTGEVDASDHKVKRALSGIAVRTYVNYLKAKDILLRTAAGKAFFTELNTDSYAGFYLAAIESDIDIVRWASSNRDNAYFLQHLDRQFHSWHHSSLAPATWARVRDERFNRDRELDEFFAKRYGGEWAVFARNYKGTREASVEEIRTWLGVQAEDRIAIVYSHILYDTLYFYGDDLFDSYAEWLIETVRAACRNDRLTWLVKLHPSNVWRGEKKAGEYEEELLIARHIGKLPAHVRLIPPDTPFRPISWMKVADFGITVRGTAGMEMATMGKGVITAGRGRFDRCGFTHDPDTADEYRALLAQLPGIPALTEDQVRAARHYMHAVFVRKAFSITSLETALATGKRELSKYNDLILMPSESLRGQDPAQWPDVRELAAWLKHRDRRDYLAA